MSGLVSWASALASAFDLAAPWALLLLPLPLLAARLIPAEAEGGSGALRVPASLVARAQGGAEVAARGRRRTVLVWTLWAALVSALSGPRLVLPGVPEGGEDDYVVLPGSSCRRPRSRPRGARSCSRWTCPARWSGATSRWTARP